MISDKGVADSARSGPTRIALVTRVMSGGGARRQMIETARNLDKSKYEVTIVTLYPEALFTKELDGVQGVDRVSLDKKGRFDIFSTTRRFLKLCKQQNIRLIWTYSGGFEYGVVAKILLRCRLVMGIRHSGLDAGKYGFFHNSLFRLQALLSRLTDIMVSNSWAGRTYFGGHGYKENQILVIPNGFDTNEFSRTEEGRRKTRAAWGYGPDVFLVGLVGRIDPQKDHPTFIRAAAELKKISPAFRFVCVGDGSDQLKSQLQNLCTELKVADVVNWAGTSNDMPAIYSALDLLVLCSAFGEGTPNAVGEAMACSTPCVVTDAGDSARLLDDPSRTLPIGDFVGLAKLVARIEAMSPEARQAVGERDRERIDSLYSLEQLAERTAAVVAGVMEGGTANQIEAKLASVRPSGV